MLKSLETARKEKFIGAPLEARVRLSADGDLYPLLEQYARELPGLFIVSQVELENQPARASGQDRAGARREVRTLLEVHRGRGLEPELPTVCAACAAAVREMLA